MLRRLSSLCLAMVVAVVALLSSPPPPAVGASFTDIDGSPFRHHIEWLAARGITQGCGDGRFCPTRDVSREEMASFLVRLFALPPSDVDHFSDDEDSRHEAAINAIASAGITGGCAAGWFCPEDTVSRAQMAAFLSRAASLPPTSRDHFLDDERSGHAISIDRAAATGIATGCGVHLFCPGGAVTREQMAAFLRRVLEPGPAPAALPDVGPLPACRYDDLLTSRRTLDAWGTTLLDTIYRLPADYAPNDLASTSAAGANAGHSVRGVALADLTALVSAARSAGRSISIVSAYRSYATQVAVFADNVARYGEAVALRRSARPGHSEHQLGTTIDVTHAGGSAPWNYADWATHPAGAWMRDNAWRYGFVMSYPKGAEAKVCYDYEPWHYRYIGRGAASNLRQSGLTLREWIWRRYGP